MRAARGQWSNRERRLHRDPLHGLARDERAVCADLLAAAPADLPAHQARVAAREAPLQQLAGDGWPEDGIAFELDTMDAAANAEYAAPLSPGVVAVTFAVMNANAWPLFTVTLDGQGVAMAKARDFGSAVDAAEGFVLQRLNVVSMSPGIRPRLSEVQRERVRARRPTVQERAFYEGRIKRFPPGVAAVALP